METTTGRHQAVVLNGQSPNWSHVGGPHGSILWLLLFLVDINEVPDGVTTNDKLFEDDTKLFLLVHDSEASSTSLNNSWLKISWWAY